MCDVAYVLCVERVERRTVADRQVVATLMAAGAKGVAMPDVDAAVADFDRMLAAEPKTVSPERAVLLRALGLRRAG